LKVYLPPLHIKLGIIKNFLQEKWMKIAPDSYIVIHVSRGLSDAKIKGDVFVGPQIR
jgi:hypothetical protein